MPSTKVTRPTDIDAYECDNARCREVCESYTAHNCDWVWVEVPEFPVYLRERARRWFCSWSCMAAWACYMQEAYPIKARQPSFPPGLPF
jgi:hypothetical protein